MLRAFWYTTISHPIEMLCLVLWVLAVMYLGSIGFSTLTWLVVALASIMTLVLIVVAMMSGFRRKQTSITTVLRPWWRNRTRY